MKKRSDGRYCKQIFVGYQPNGTRKLKTIYGKTIREVEKRERELLSQMEKGLIPTQNADITLSDWADEWMTVYKSSLSYNTRIRYKNIIDVHIKPKIGYYKLNQVKLSTIQKLINDMSDYSMSTIKKVKDTFHQMYTAAIINELVFKDPTVGLVLPKKQSDQQQPISDETAKKLTDFSRNNDIGIFPLTLLYTGMRRGEALALSWKDIDFDKKIITVNKSVVFHSNRPVISSTKTRNSNRTIPLLDVLYDELLKYKIRYTGLYGKEIQDKPVFVNSLGEMHTNTSQRKLWIKFLKEFNAYFNTNEKFGMHQLRHTFCTILYKAETDIKTTQAILGHSDISITLKIYTHLDQEQKQHSIDKINKYVSQKSVKTKNNRFAAS